jgi:hypothetical protein
MRPSQARYQACRLLNRVLSQAPPPEVWFLNPFASTVRVTPRDLLGSELPRSPVAEIAFDSTRIVRPNSGHLKGKLEAMPCSPESAPLHLTGSLNMPRGLRPTWEIRDEGSGAT